MARKKDNSKVEVIQSSMKELGFKLKKASEIEVLDKIRTNIFALDYVIDGGLSQDEGGHRIEFYGAESSCKTTTALMLLSLYIANGKKALYIVNEGNYDSEWGSKLGIDNDKLDIAKPANLEEAGDILCAAVPIYDIILYDSIPALASIHENEESLEEKNMAEQAKIYAPMTRKLYSAFAHSRCTIIFINQLREKVGIAYGSPFITPGGRALKHLYNTRVEFKSGDLICATREGEDDKDKKKEKKEDKNVIGREIKLYCPKNKKGVPYRTSTMDFYNNGIIDNNKSLLYAGLKYGIIQQSGHTYIYDDKKAVGIDKFKELLTEKDSWKEIEIKIWEEIRKSGI